MSPLELNLSSMLVNYRDRTIGQVLHDLIVMYGKREILYLIAKVVEEKEGTYPILQCEDGSLWLSFDDYDASAHENNKERFGGVQNSYSLRREAYALIQRSFKNQDNFDDLLLNRFVDCVIEAAVLQVAEKLEKAALKDV